VRITTIGAAQATSLLWRMQKRLRATLIVKATFALQSERDMEIAPPDDIIDEERHYKGSVTRSVRLTSDLAPFLKGADVLLTGDACAPRGTAVTFLPVRLAVVRGKTSLIDKSIHVFGDRRGGAPAKPFERMPIVYERAFGGPGWKANPLGVGHPPSASADLPNIVDPADASRTTGFGPISRAWPSRKGMLSAADRKAISSRPVAEIPNGFDWSYFQAAPEDQRTAPLKGDEWIVLAGVHPDIPILRSRLPDVAAHARIFGLFGLLGHEPADAWRPLSLYADTLRIDSDSGRCSLTWRGSLTINDESRVDLLEGMVGVSIGGEAIAWPERSLAPAPVEAPSASDAEDAEIDFAETLLRAESGQKAPPAPKISEQTVTIAAPPRDEPPAGRSLPFEVAKPGAASPLAVPRAAREPNDFSGTVALSPDRAGEPTSRPATPFSRAAAPAPPSPIAPPEVFAPVAPPPLLFPLVPPGPAAIEEPETAPLPGFSDAASPSRSEPDIEPVSAGVSVIAADVPPRAQDAIPVVTRTPLVAFTLPWSHKPGRASRTVIVKGSFDLVPGGAAALRDETDMPIGDVHAGDEPLRSVLYPSDFALWKPKTDVTLKGHAYAPGGSAQAAEVRFRFGKGKNSFDRSVVVFGDRRWQGQIVKLAPTDPKRFQRVPLVYEHAFGGPGFAKNPIGMGYGGSALLPQLEDPTRLVKSPEDRPEPVCFCGLSPRWEARASKLGTYDARWQKTRWPYFPDDFDWAYYQAAPAAQQLDYINGDEPFEVSGAHPKHPVLRGKLPGIRPRCFAQGTAEAGNVFHEILLRLDTVSFDVDEMKLNLVWRGLMEVRDDAASEIAELFLAIDEPSAPIGLAEARSRYEAAKAPAEVQAEEPDADIAANDTRAPAEAKARREHLPPERDPVRREVEARLAAGAMLAGGDFAGANLSDIDFSGQSLAGAILKDARLVRCRLAGANLSDAQLSGADLTDASLERATLEGADFTGAILDGAVMDGAALTGAVFEAVSGQGASFREAKGEGVSFAEGVLPRARFDRAALPSADFTKAYIDDAVFDSAVLPEIRLYEARGAKVSFKDADLTEARADGGALPRASFVNARAPSSVWDKADLSGASFLGAALPGASFVKASCERVVFSGADLSEGRLGHATLTKASFIKTNLMAAAFEGADLSSADLRGSNLYGAETWKAKLQGADLTHAFVAQTKLEGSR
jgi:uncharacterized protein YjbI with pentapeptide repeats